MANKIELDAREFTVSQCAHAEAKGGVLHLCAEPESDLFNIPGVHVKNNMGTVCCTLSGDFSLAADVKVKSAGKFDAAGLFLQIAEQKFKYVIENYLSDYKLVSVRLSPFSDEVNGQGFEQPNLRLFVSRKGPVVSFYYRNNEALRFHRAIYLQDAPSECEVGFAVQAPFSSGAEAWINNIEITDHAMEDIRE